jgi:hypothetical protein
MSNATDFEMLPSPNFDHLDAATRAEIARLYHEAFERFGTLALWNVRHFPDPTPGQALAITKALRIYAKMPGRRLAERIEEVCDAAH